MDLPEELLDEILGHLPLDDERSLRSCSLVSRSWLGPSRRLLFANIRIRRDNHQSWLNNISPTNTQLLRHARSLTYFYPLQETPDPRYCIRLLRHYLPSFRQLKTLNLCKLTVELTTSEHLTLFSAFQNTLSSLSLTQVSITWSSFVALVGYFPRLRDLNICKPSFRVGDWPIPQMTHPLRGRLFIQSLLGEGMVPFINLFPKLRQEYEELEMFAPFLPRLISASEKSLKYLKFHRCKSGTAPNLSRFAELRQLQLFTMRPKEEDRILISSITSINLQQIIFAPYYSGHEWMALLEDPCWKPFDDMICGLVDRLRVSGSEHTLEVQFRVTFPDFGSEEHHELFLRKFKEKGRVRIVLASGRVREWP